MDILRKEEWIMKQHHWISVISLSLMLSLSMVFIQKNPLVFFTLEIGPDAHAWLVLLFLLGSVTGGSLWRKHPLDPRFFNLILFLFVIGIGVTTATDPLWTTRLYGLILFLIGFWITGLANDLSSLISDMGPFVASAWLIIGLLVFSLPLQLVAYTMDDTLITLVMMIYATLVLGMRVWYKNIDEVMDLGNAGGIPLRCGNRSSLGVDTKNSLSTLALIFSSSILKGIYYETMLKAQESGWEHFWIELPSFVLLMVFVLWVKGRGAGAISGVGLGLVGISLLTLLLGGSTVQVGLGLGILFAVSSTLLQLAWWGRMAQWLEGHGAPHTALAGGLAVSAAGYLTFDYLIDVRPFGFGTADTLYIGLAIVMLMILMDPILSRLPVGNLQASLNGDGPRVDAWDPQPGFLELGNLLEYSLTKREGEVAEQLSRGYTYKMIAEHLFLSENTVRTHIANIYSKVGVKNKSDFIRILMTSKEKQDK